ncbi:probable carboxylesterase 11 [Rhododendron vialii]|uniref:probable carboxylesterase 11 n=1 Tax=Rhododendron vialii TaxID=182163 RepID=UPI00265FDC82|nr:probable carboxylesterase 11 [Rhododendron vialii]
MPSVAVKLYSVFFKFLLKHRLQNRIQGPADDNANNNHTANPFGVTSRPEESIAAVNPSFTDGVATKDIHIDPLTSVSIRIFLPDTCLDSRPQSTTPRTPRVRSLVKQPDSLESGSDPNRSIHRRNSYGPELNNVVNNSYENHRRNSYGCIGKDLDNGVYRGYSPLSIGNSRKLPLMLQFHGGGFVTGSNESVANDFFCRRIAKLCDVMVIAVGYRLAPENRYPGAFEDGLKVLHWLAKQANLAECGKSLGNARGGGGVADLRKSGEGQRHVADAFGASLVEPWLAAHGDPSRCVLLGVSCGANIADYVARKAVESGRLLDPIKVVAQVLMYPFFIGNVPTHSEIKLANSYFFDKAMCILAWKLFLPEEEFSLDHPAANPLIPNREPPLKLMPPTLTVVAEHDWMRDRAIAYSEALRKVNVDAPVLEYKDAVHEFATLDMLLKTPQAQACAEDIAIWVKKYISLRGHEFSY